MPTETPPRRKIGHQVGRRRLKGLFRSQFGAPDAFGSERSFSPEIGRHWDPEGPPRGGYLDFRFKIDSPQWPPPWLGALPDQLHVAAVQWGLGGYERFLEGEGEQWLHAALRAGEHLVETQHRGGLHDGGWRHHFPMPHTYRISPPWISCIAQGEAASFLVRLYLETGDERFGEAAKRALLPMEVSSSEGGNLALLDGDPMLEEYPTSPPSFVLNGAIFALWGYRDVGVGVNDPAALARFEELTSALAAHIHRWDSGYWSLYDLYPHLVPNVASPAYHLLHIRQLEVLERLSPRPQLTAAKDRFQRYRASDECRRKAMRRKVAFRVAVPRNALLAQRAPWDPAVRSAAARSRKSHVLVLCYHAISTDWEAPLSITPEQLSGQLDHLRGKGFEPATFADAVAGRGQGKQLVVTFDDAYRSVERLARPVLEAHGFVGTVFAPTDFIGSEQPMSWPGIDQWLGGPHEEELLPMSWDELRGLAGQGWEIGSHTCTHPKLPELDDASLREELERSRAACEQKLGRPCESLAYPYGKVDGRVMEAAVVAGYSAAAALAPDGIADSSFHWPRVGIYHVDGTRSFRLKVSRPLRGLQRSRVWRPLRNLARPVRPPRSQVR